MNRNFIGLVLTFLVVAGVLIFKATSESTATVLLPSDLIKAGSASSLTRIRVGARIADAEILYTVEPKIELRFNVEDPKDPNGSIPVIYNGLKPDMFASGRDVIIDGEYIGGTLIASRLLTQCPSKYEPPKG